MRLRTVVARWLRDQLFRTFNEWKLQRQYTRELIMGAERVAEKTLTSTVKAAWDSWRGIVTAQEHKREVLTRILLRIQDRSAFKAIHAWSGITTHIHRCRLQADRGLAKTQHSVRDSAFCAWQRTRLRGLKAIAMIDAAFTRWNTHILGWSLAAMFNVARRKRIIRERGMWLMHKRGQRQSSLALDEW